MQPRSHHFLSLGPDGFHRVAYVDWGSAAQAHVVVYVHGLSRNSRDFDFLARELAKDCRVVCMDVVGRGQSEWLADKSGYCFPTYLQDAAALLARITMPSPPDFFGELKNRWRRRKPAAALDGVGTSMGGLIGLMLAARRNSPIRRLVLNDVGPFIPWDALIGIQGHFGGDYRFGSMVEVTAWFRQACAEFGTHPDAYWQHLAQHGVIEDGAGGYRLRYDPGIVRGLPVHRDPEFPIGPDFLRGIDLWALWIRSAAPGAGAARGRFVGPAGRRGRRDAAPQAGPRSGRVCRRRARAGVGDGRPDLPHSRVSGDGRMSLPQLNVEVLARLLDVRMPFGKHVSKPIADLPGNYPNWFAREGFPKGEIGLLLALMHEIDHNGLSGLPQPLRQQRGPQANAPRF